MTVKVNTSPPDLIKSTTCLCVDPSTFTLFLNTKKITTVRSLQINRLPRKSKELQCLHFEYPVSLADARVERSTPFQHGTDVLQRGVKLAIDALQLAALADLTADVKPETGDALGDDHFPWARRHFRRHGPSTKVLHRVRQRAKRT